VLTILAGALRDLVLPASCIGCSRPGVVLCGQCCAVPEPDVAPVGGIPVSAAATYDAGVRAALISYKERDRRDLALPLGALLAKAVGAPRPNLVPMPSARASQRRRGGDHVLRLARVAARELDGRIATPLRMCRPVLDSAGLGAAQRRANLAGAMAAAPPQQRETPVVLVDDIVTSGATMGEAIRALRSSGWLVTAAAAVAATPHRYAAAR